MKTFPRHLVQLAAMLCMACGQCACSTVRVTDQPRTATDFFLISKATSEAIPNLSVEPLRDRKVYLDSTYFKSYDQEYVLGEVRAYLFSEGVRLMDEREQSDIILELRTAGIGVDRYENLVGIPSLAVPAAAAAGAPTSLVTPEIALLKHIKQRGYASIAYVAYWRESREIVASSGPFIGRSYRNDWWVLGFGPSITGNIPSTLPAPQESNAP